MHTLLHSNINMYVYTEYVCSQSWKQISQKLHTHIFFLNNTYIQKNMGSYCLQLIPKDTLKDLLQFKKNLGVPV